MMKGIGSVLVVVCLLGLLSVTGCESEAQQDAVIGGALGAAAGQVIGGNTESTLIGAGLGAGAGYMYGNERDKARMRSEMEANREMANTAVVNVTNSNGSITPVTLRRRGGKWIGPRGEEYLTLPTPEQLRTIYGF